MASERIFPAALWIHYVAAINLQFPCPLGIIGSYPDYEDIMRNPKLPLLLFMAVISTQALAVTPSEFDALKKTVALQQAQISQLQAAPRVCRGTSKGTTNWEQYAGGTKYATATINTSSCKFKKVPTYFVSARTESESGTWELGGYTGIYLPTTTTFQVFVWNGYNPNNPAFNLVNSTKFYFEWIGVE
jgi:hypothetical protein